MQTITLLVAIAETAASINPSKSNLVPKSLQVSRTLVLCPPSLIENWNDEFLTWAPKDILGSVRRVDLSKVMQTRLEIIEDWYEEGGILLMGYQMFSKIVVNKSGKNENISDDQHQAALEHLLQGPNIVVADEAHMLKNAASGIAKSTRRFRTKSRIALTGSPLANKLEEYYAMIEFIAPGKHPYSRTFG